MDTDTQALLKDRQGFQAAWLIWIFARNRTSGVIEAGGFWTGDDHQVFTISGEQRTYFGAGSVLDVGDIRYAPGLVIEMQSCSLTITAKAEQVFQEFDPALQRIEIHKAIFHPVTMALTAEPERRFVGTVDAAPIEDGPRRGIKVIRLTAAPRARDLTARPAVYKSDAALRTHAPDDGFRRYAGQGQRDVPWGQNSAQRI